LTWRSTSSATVRFSPRADGLYHEHGSTRHRSILREIISTKAGQSRSRHRPAAFIPAIQSLSAVSDAHRWLLLRHPLRAQAVRGGRTSPRLSLVLLPRSRRQGAPSLDVLLCSALPRIAAGSEPRRHLRSAPTGDIPPAARVAKSPPDGVDRARTQLPLRQWLMKPFQIGHQYLQF
jgi:hypothetical protein